MCLALNVISYNVNGLENKILFNDFFQYIRSYDIFLLLETHISEQNVERFRKFFGGYDTFWRPAVRNSNYGRAIGGCVYGVKKDLKTRNIKCYFKTEEEIDVIVIKIQNTEMNVIPLYLRAATWNADFEAVKNFFTNKVLVNPIIIGDLNIRIGNIQQYLDDFIRVSFKSGLPERSSRDSVANSKGKRFCDFCQDFGLHIVNGCTIGDEVGNFTYIGGTGQSVIDICALSHEILQNIESFKVDGKTWSDHMPIILTLNVMVNINSNQTMTLLPKLKWDEMKVEEYKDNLNRHLNILKQQQEEFELADLTKIICLANPAKEKFVKPVKTINRWFNFKCYNAREKSFIALNKFRQNPTDENKEKYLEVNVKYKKLCETTKFAYFKNLESQINLVNNSKEWWNIFKEIKQVNTPERPDISAWDFKQYFCELLNPPQISNDIIYAPMYYSNEDLDCPITPTEIKNVLAKSKYNKAPGEDRVSYEFLKNATECFIEELTKSYNVIFESAKLDEKFITSIIFPIFKKGDKAAANNYRGISFMNSVAKTMMGILNNRLNKWLDKHNIITEFQAGFRQGYSTSDNIYNLAAIAHIKFNEKRKLYAFFVDFRAAFDKVSRKSLIYKLNNIGISTKMINMIESIYSKTNFTVWTGEELSEKFETTSGVKQGCLLSPTLFSIYLNDLHDFIKGGVNIENLNVRLLLYADDIVLLADDINIMQEMICNLEKYCLLWNLEVNISKSEMVIFRNGGKLSKLEKFRFNGEPIKVTAEYTYLGVTLTPKMSFSKHLEKRNISAKNNINATWKNFLGKKEISLKAKWSLFQSVCRAIQSYGAQVWGFTHFEEVDKLQRFFLKKVLKLPSFTPTYVLLLETDIQSNHIYTLDLHLRYIIKTLFLYSNSRLPNRLTRIILEKQLFWFSHINKLCRDLNTAHISDCSSREDWESLREDIIFKLNNNHKTTLLQRASETSRFYKKLNYDCKQQYFEDIPNTNIISWMFKVRCDLIELNATRFQQHRSKKCSLCNLDENEDLYHFLAKCPILRHIRYKCFKKIFLTEIEVISLLNNVSTTYKELTRYIIDALDYRKELIIEFNY